MLYRVVTERLVLAGEAHVTGNSTPTRAKLISNEGLAGAAERLHLWDALYLGVGERRNNAASGRQRFMACAMEAVIGAVYLDASLTSSDGPTAAATAVGAVLAAGGLLR